MNLTMVDHFDVQEWFKRCRKTLLGSRAANGLNYLVNNIILVPHSFNSGIGLYLDRKRPTLYLISIEFSQRNYIEEMST